MALKLVDDMTVEEIAFILRHEELITTWLAAVAGRADALMRRGQSVPGFKLVQGRAGNRQWSVSDLHVIQAIQKETGAELDDIAPRVVIGPPDAEKLFKRTLGRGVKWKEPFQRVADYITRSPGKLTIAPMTDPRPEVRPAELDFTGDNSL